MPPPPEKPEAARTRTNIILSFWAVILLLGVPTWWRTTAIPRAALPLEDMINWESNRPTYPINIRIAAPDLGCAKLGETVARSQELLDKETDFPAFQIRLQPVAFTNRASKGSRSDDDNSGCSRVEYIVGDQASDLDIELREGDGFLLDLSAQDAPGTAIYSRDNTQNLASCLATALSRVFADEKAAVARMCVTHGDSSAGLQQYISTLSQETIGSIERNVARAFKPFPNYHLTFSLFTAGGTPSSWDIESALGHYIQPLLHSLSSTANFTVTTQVQMYSAMSPSIQPNEDPNHNGWFLRQNDLTAFINTAEWPLSPSIGSGPTINFILYVPTKSQIPLRIEGTDSSSWLIPQWGGIAILNPPLAVNSDTNVENVVTRLQHEELQKAFETFQSQLLLLLGVSVAANPPFALRLNAFKRLSGLSLYLRTTSNLSSLARLAQGLSNIPIPHHVSQLVDLATSNLLSFREQRSLNAVRIAFDASEKAFFDKSMVGQVYFPDEHKVAVYLPLLGPIGVPLVVGLLREIKRNVLKR